MKLIRALPFLLLALVLALPVEASSTFTENWSDLSNWTQEQPGHASVSGGYMTTSGDTVLSHNTIRFNRALPATLSGTVQAIDIKTQTPNYCGMVLIDEFNTNYYGSLAPNNWVDTLNGILPPNVESFGNEYRFASEYWSHYAALRKTSANQLKSFSLTWTPSLPDGSRGSWTIVFQGQNTISSPDLPMTGNLRPALYITGRCVVGPLTMTGS